MVFVPTETIHCKNLKKKFHEFFCGISVKAGLCLYVPRDKKKLKSANAISNKAIKRKLNLKYRNIKISKNLRIKNIELPFSQT